jgi:hypothetical protein
MKSNKRCRSFDLTVVQSKVFSNFIFNFFDEATCPLFIQCVCFLVSVKRHFTSLILNVASYLSRADFFFLKYFVDCLYIYFILLHFFSFYAIALF